MQKKAGASPSGSPIATPSRNVPGVSRSFFVLSCHSKQKRDLGAVMKERTLKARAVGSGQTGLVITWPLNGKRHRRDLRPGRILWRRGQIALDQMGAYHHAFGADERNAHAA